MKKIKEWWKTKIMKRQLKIFQKQLELLRKTEKTTHDTALEGIVDREKNIIKTLVYFLEEALKQKEGKC